MKKLLPLLVLLVFVATGLWAQFYGTLPREERKTLAEAYYLVGQQYEQKGDNQKARDFEDMAFNIDPGLNPADIQLKDLPSAAALILEGKAKLAAVPRTRAEATHELIKSKFLRWISELLSKDSSSMLALMEGSVNFTDLGAEIVVNTTTPQYQWLPRIRRWPTASSRWSGPAGNRTEAAKVCMRSSLIVTGGRHRLRLA